MPIDKILCVKNARAWVSMDFTSDKYSAPRTIKKMKIALPIWLIWPNVEVNGLDWQCCLAGSSKTAPRILMFSITMGADYSFYVKTIAMGLNALRPMPAHF